MINNVFTIFRRELLTYFSTPLAYVFIVIFLGLSGSMAFFSGSFFERNQADLISFFTFHPWLYLIFAPAIAMRLWAEERKTGTIEILMTLPVTTGQAVAAKFLAAWAFLLLTLVLTFPLWVTVNYLGEPDNAVIFGGYLGSWLMAGAYLGLCSCLSALTKNQVIAFIIGAAACFIFMMSGLTIVLGIFQDWAPSFVIDLISSLSFITHFNGIAKGVIDLRSVIYFSTFIVLVLYLNTVIIEFKKAS
ncbi:MAG: ABC transporter permease subunit [Rhodospirillales bacterium]|jgi:ABC-2 type transport system permease protein